MAKSWNEFNRSPHLAEFFACVNEEGFWEDSAGSYRLAIHWCCLADGESDLSPDGEQAYVDGTKWSIIHSSLLQKMYEAGLIS